MPDFIDITPSARKMISLFMNLGHNFQAAVADLVDNSIAAGATEVEIYVKFDGKKSAVRIADNGKGMSPETLDEAMRFCSERNYGESDLGKFGIGLKSASLSQCRKFTVASRPDDGTAGIYASTFDMDHVEKNGQWQAIRVPADKLEKNVMDPLHRGFKTVIFWHQIESVLGFKNPNSKWAEKHVLEMCRCLEEHLAMVFHRFMSDGSEQQQVEIKLNGRKISPWDPFAQDENHTRRLKKITFPIEKGAEKGEVVWEPFVLPPQEQFSSHDACDKAAGPKKWNGQQGFYIYRANRMIQSGGWCGLYATEHHHQLARIALRFPPSLDEAFQIDLAKMRVQLPNTIIEEIKRQATYVRKIANYVYRNKILPGPPPLIPPDPPLPEPPEPPPLGPPSPPPPTIAPWREWNFDKTIVRLRKAATDDELPILNAIIERAKKQAREEQ